MDGGGLLSDEDLEDIRQVFNLHDHDRQGRVSLKVPIENLFASDLFHMCRLLTILH